MPELLQWAIVNPRQPETYAQAAALMASPSKQCCGLKIHPESLDDEGTEGLKG